MTSYQGPEYAAMFEQEDPEVTAMTAQRPPLVVYERPICNYEHATGGRCRRVARWTIDGVWLCDEHSKAGDFGRLFGHAARPIVWER